MEDVFLFCELPVGMHEGGRERGADDFAERDAEPAGELAGSSRMASVGVLIALGLAIPIPWR